MYSGVPQRCDFLSSCHHWFPSLLTAFASIPTPTPPLFLQFSANFRVFSVLWSFAFLSIPQPLEFCRLTSLGVGDHLTCNLKSIRCLLSNVMHWCIAISRKGLLRCVWANGTAVFKKKETCKKLNSVTQTHGALLLKSSTRRHPAAACSAQPCSPLPWHGLCSTKVAMCALTPQLRSLPTVLG